MEVNRVSSLDEFNALTHKMMEEYKLPELHARCYIVNYYTLHMCDRCKSTNDCAFIHALEREREENK